MKSVLVSPAGRSQRPTFFHHLRPRQLLIPLIVLTTLGLKAAMAQDGIGEAAYLEDIPLVLSAARLAQPVTEAPAAVTVIDREMIEASGARQIADLFRLVPGFTVAWWNGYTPSVTYHGLADEYSRRMQVLIDGRSVYLPSVGGVAWSDLALTIDDIERIEVIRGPDSASYGANSFLAVISIITRDAAEDQGSSVRMHAGEHRIRDGVARYGGGSQDLTWHVTAGYTTDDGFDRRFDTQRTRLVNANVDYQMGVNDNLEAQTGLSDGPRQTGYTDDFADPPHGRDVVSHFERLRWLHTPAPAQELSVQFYHNYHNTDEDYQSLPLDLTDLGIGVLQLPLNYDIRTERYDLEVQHTLAPRQDLRVVWGGSARHDNVTSPTYFGKPDALDINLYRLFGNAEWHIRPALVTNFGALYEYNDITGGDVSPRLAANYHLNDHQTLRAVISTATRTPTLFEDQADWKITADTPVGTLIDQQYLSHGILDAERIISREIGWLFNRPERGTAVDVKIYHDRLYNLIRQDYAFFRNAPDYVEEPRFDEDGNLIDNVCLEPDTNSCYNYHVLQNRDSAAISGIEAQIDQRLFETTRIIAGFAYISIDDNDPRHRLNRSAPTDSAFLLLIQKLPADSQASLAYYQYGEMEYLDSGNHTNLQRRLDLRLARRFKHDADQFQVAVVAQNLLDNYADFLNNQSTGLRNLFDTRVFLELGWEMP